MTAIEFFDKTPIENIINALTTAPKKIIYIGNGNALDRGVAIYRELLEKRGIKDIELCEKRINRNDVNAIFDTLCQVVENEDELLFDLTGGDDLVLVAMGMVYEKYLDTKRIQMQRLNIESGVVSDCDNDGNLIYLGEPTLSVDECVRLHGGVIRYGSGIDQTYKWNMTEDFISDIEKTWEICKCDPAWWNKRIDIINALCDAEKNKSLDMVMSAAKMDEYLKKTTVKKQQLSDLLKELSAQKIIRNLCDNERGITFSYKNDQIKKFLSKAGNALEMKVMVTAMQVTEDDGNACYNDAMNGVYIDWDGEIHNQSSDKKDTKNEIDVILTSGITPVFISCKNGHVDDEELYKLDVVASRFGGTYVKKVLIATYIDKNPDSLKYFTQRAKDMHIDVIYNVHEMSESKLKRRIKNLIKNKV